MTILGAGLCNIGSSPAGFGDPGSGEPGDRRVLLTRNALHGNCRKIDPATKDYVFRSSGMPEAQDTSTQQRVYLALATVRGSAVVPTLGLGLSNVKVIGRNIESQIRSEVEQALSSLIQEQAIALEAVLIQRTPSNAIYVQVRWKDLASGEDVTSTI
jgi:hypothetical protein